MSRFHPSLDSVAGATGEPNASPNWHLGPWTPPPKSSKNAPRIVTIVPPADGPPDGVISDRRTRSRS